MKLTSVRYLVANGFKNIWLNKLMSIASIGVLVACMSVIGLAVAVSLNVDHTLSELEQQNVVMVYFEDRNSALYKVRSEQSADATLVKAEKEITEDDYTIHNLEEALLLCEKIKELDNINSIEYFSSDEVLESAKSSVSQASPEIFSLIENPMSCGAKVTMTDLSLFDDTIKEIEKLHGVDEVSSLRDIAEKITTIKRAIAIVGFWIVAILMIIALVIVSNTIRVTMYSRKLEISIMKAVGATDSFVRLPFMIEGVTIGLLSAGITIAILYFVYNAVQETVKSALSLTAIIPFTDFFWLIFGIFGGIGCFAGLFASAIMINKYLRKEGSEFRAL